VRKRETFGQAKCAVWRPAHNERPSEPRQHAAVDQIAAVAYAANGLAMRNVRARISAALADNSQGCPYNENKMEERMKRNLLAGFMMILVASGCATRSIFNSGYREDGYRGYRGGNSLYRGELSEFAVLGIDAGREISEQDIIAASSEKKERLTLRKGDPLLLIQSGAIIPDQEMSDGMSKCFSVSVFTGVPEVDKKTNLSYSKSLRYAAAKAGIEKILVYWGVLESGTRNLVTKTISWVPIVGWAVPDQAQQVRIRLKVSLIDVRTGQWEMFLPKVYEDTAFSPILGREQSDQEQVALLKGKAYQTAVESILTRYVR